MTIHQFIVQNNVRPADAIVLRKKFLGMVDHYVIYMGIVDGRHLFVANYSPGVRVVSPSEMAKYLRFLVPSAVERFPGKTAAARNAALRRARSRIGERDYRYFSNNCESFKNYVHYGENRSEQAENFKTGAKAAGAVLLGGLLVAGLISALSGDDEEYD